MLKSKYTKKPLQEKLYKIGEKKFVGVPTTFFLKLWAIKKVFLKN